MDDSPPGPDYSPPGLDLARLTDWLDVEHPQLRSGPLQAEVIAGGRSNLTYRLTDGSHTWALRRPPLGHVLPTAHDMAREYQVISALHESAVPVPEPVLLNRDPHVLGAPFYLMGFVPGIVVDRPELAPDPAAARRVSELLVDTLVALHAADPAAVGLAEFGRPDGFLARQVARWHRQFEASVPDALPIEAEAVARLIRLVPDSSGAGIVHGDYRLTNVLYRPDLTAIDAVVDWEMATLGDPLTDVGLLYVYHELAGESDAVMVKYPSTQGYLTPDELIERYADQTGNGALELDWYIAFGYFKLAVIAAGIDARYRAGQTVGAGFDTFGPLVTTTLERAVERLGKVA